MRYRLPFDNICDGSRSAPPNPLHLAYVFGGVTMPVRPSPREWSHPPTRPASDPARRLSRATPAGGYPRGRPRIRSAAAVRRI